MEKWRKIPVILRWMLYPFLLIILPILSSIPLLLIMGITLRPEEGSFFWNASLLVQSIISTVVFFWAVCNLAPNGKKLLGWMMFGLLLLYVILSNDFLLLGKSIFGQQLNLSVSRFWILQNVVWLVTGLVSTVLMTREKETR